MDSEGALSFSEEKSSQNIVSYGDKKNGGRDEKYPSRLTVQCNASSPLLGKKGWFSDAMERRRSEFAYPNLYPEPY